MTPQEILRRVSELKGDIEHLASSASVWTLAAYLASMAEQEVVSILYDHNEHRPLETSSGLIPEIEGTV